MSDALDDIAGSTQALARDLKAAGFVEQDTGLKIDGHSVIVLRSPADTARRNRVQECNERARAYFQSLPSEYLGAGH